MSSELNTAKIREAVDAQRSVGIKIGGYVNDDIAKLLDRLNAAETTIELMQAKLDAWDVLGNSLKGSA